MKTIFSLKDSTFQERLKLSNCFEQKIFDFSNAGTMSSNTKDNIELINNTNQQMRRKRENELERIRQNQQKRLKSIENFNLIKVFLAKSLLIPQNFEASSANLENLEQRVNLNEKNLTKIF